MNNRVNMYDMLGWIAVVSVPLAPVFFFGHRIYRELLQLTGWAWWSLFIGFAGAIGLEIVGILAGHMASEFWQSEKPLHAGISALVLMGYVTVGVAELWGTVGAVMFVIAPMVYLLLAMRETHGHVRHKTDQVKATRLAYELEQEALDRQLARELKARRLELRHQEKLALAAPKPTETQMKPTETETETRRNQAKPKPKPTKPAETKTKPVETNAKPTRNRNRNTNRDRVFETLQRNPNATNTQISETIGISPQMVGRYRKEFVNGVSK